MKTTTHPLAIRIGRQHGANRRGVVLVITLLAILLIAGLLAYTMNLGDQVGRKIETQNAADSSAIAGATQVARSMNGVALNNTAMARNIALINIMDAIPLAVDFSLTEVEETKLADVSALYQAVNHQIKLGFNNMALTTPEQALLLREFQKAREAIGEPGGSNQDKSDEAMLRQMDDFFKRNPNVIPDMTFYNAPGGGNGGRGQIWNALSGLDKYNKTLIQSMGTLAQINAVEAGEENLPEADGAAAFIAPVLPYLPTKRGKFNDFQRPVMSGLLPEDVDNTRTNRGPWDTIYGFRHRQGGGGGYARSGHDQLADPPRWNPPVAPSEATYPNRYSVFGTQEAQIRVFTRVEEQKYYTRLGAHLRRIANIKAGYIWPKRNDSTNDTLQKINKPDWEVDVERDNERSTAPKLYAYKEGDNDTARDRMDDNFNIIPLVPPDLKPQPNTIYSYADYNKSLPNRYKIIKETMYLVLDVYHADEHSTFDPNRRYTGGNDKNKPTDWFIQMHGRFHGRLSMNIRNGWADPNGKTPPIGRLRSNIRENQPSIVPPSDPSYKLMYPDPRTDDYDYKMISTGRRDFYRETIRYETNPWVPAGKYINGGFPELGFEPIKVGETFVGEGDAKRLVAVYKAQPYWRTRYIFLVGINIGPDILVRDPYTGFDPNGANAPAPTDLDHSVIGADSANKQNYLSVLGYARQPSQSEVWGSKFTPSQPHKFVTSVAQAKVFNNHSWDLWTQMWQAQLEPVNNLKGWSERMNVSEQSDLSRLGLDSKTVSDTKEFLNSIEGLSEGMISH
jgi:hypothetical protein